MSIDELLTLTAAQRALGISRSTLYRLIGEGELDRVHVRSSARITRSSLKRFVEHQCQLGLLEREGF